MQRVSVLGLLALVTALPLLGTDAAAAATTPSRSMTVTLKPNALDEASGRGFLDIRIVVPMIRTTAGAPLLTLPILLSNVDTIANTMQEFRVTDATGTVPLITKDDAIGSSSWRHWIAKRTVQGDVTVTYRAPIDNRPPVRGSGPPYGLRIENGGISGVGNTFIVLPETDRTFPIDLRWDLSQLAAGSTATSSYGDGDVHLPSGSVKRLSSTIFMAGPMRREPLRPERDGFSSAWLGKPPFDTPLLMVWTRNLHTWMSSFFDDHSNVPYRVFIRYNPINAGGGTALLNSFFVTFNEKTTSERLKVTLSHEMVHTWAGGGPGAWWSEGVAVYYGALLPFRAGIFTPAEYLAAINDTARRYYSNPLNNTPDGEIEPRFWEDTRIRTLPYDRGAEYFALLNVRIQKASQGRRSVDDLILEIIRRRDAGKAVDEAAWIGLVTQELGPEGRKIHAEMMGGDLMLPPSDAFGPCFTRTGAKSRRFELGFTPKSLVGNVKTIRGLDPTSAAALAGLKDGDIVTYGVAMDSVQEDPNALLTLSVTRDGRTFPITYLPRAELVDIYQWKRDPNIPDSACVR